MIKIIGRKTEKEASVEAAKVMAEVVKNNPNGVIGLATGSSPINMYKELIRMYEAGEISFKNIRSVNLDEYVGLSADHDQSYAYFMNENLFIYNCFSSKQRKVCFSIPPLNSIFVELFQKHFERLQLR